MFQMHEVRPRIAALGNTLPVLTVRAVKRVASDWDALCVGRFACPAATQDLVVFVAASSKCRNPSDRSTGKFTHPQDFRLDAFSVTSRGSQRIAMPDVDRSGDNLRAVCEERRICQRCGPLGPRPSPAHRTSLALTKRFLGPEPQRRVVAGRLISTIPAAAKAAAKRIAGPMVSSKRSAPSRIARIGVRKENEATVEAG